MNAKGDSDYSNFKMQKLPDQTVNQIQTAYNPSVLLTRIAKDAEVSLATAFCYVRYGSTLAYLNELAERKGFEDHYDYVNWQAKQKGFKSAYERTKFLSEQNQRKPKNKELSNLINTRLDEIGETQTWLAQKSGVTKQMVSLYSSGKSFPTKRILEKIMAALS